ncbi:ABC transporter permease [Streptomyces sp. NPDC052236]|uniref:ABC transporter permease n=1 Tax=Streptomyces sp. NPDC052236 TaxID=3365686 RepID=UPI0037D077D9
MTAPAPVRTAAPSYFTDAVRHLKGLSRAELALFARSRMNLFNVLVIPAMIICSMLAMTRQYSLDEETGRGLGQMMIATSLVIILILVIYSPLTAVYVVRREEAVLKRLRTGEVADPVILIGCAIPYLAVAVTQFAVIAVVLSAVSVGAPDLPHLAVLALLLAMPLCIGLAAVSSVACRTSEAAQGVATLGLLVLLLTSGAAVPLELLPDPVESVLHFFPLTPVVDLANSAWTGEGNSAGIIAIRCATLLGWSVVMSFAARRVFRWDPRH